MTASRRRLGRRVSLHLQRSANRLLQVGILAGLLEGVRRRDPSVVVNGCLSLAFGALPGLLERRYGASVRPWQRLWVSAASLVHTVGMLGPYDRVWWWDHLAHTLSGVVVAAATDVAYRARGESREAEASAVGAPPVPGRSRARGIVCTTVGFGIVWELMEYVVHALGDRIGAEPLLVHYGRLDAVGDLLFDVIGAALVVAFGRRRLANVVESVDGTDRSAGDEP